jgi:hypothetical protein
MKCEHPHCSQCMEQPAITYLDAKGKTWEFCRLECFFWKVSDILRETRQTLEEAHQVLCQ